MTKLFGNYKQVVNVMGALLLAAIIMVPTFLVAPQAKAFSGSEQHLPLNVIKGNVQANLQSHTFTKISLFHFKKCHKGIIPSGISLKKIIYFILSPLLATVSDSPSRTFPPFEKVGLFVFDYHFLRLGALII